MGKMQREKGKRGEREVAALLREHGFEAQRGRQHKGTDDSPDVICPKLEDLDIEVKFRDKYSVNEIHDWIAKSRAETGKRPCIFHRANGKEWLVTMPAGDFLDAL